MNKSDFLTSMLSGIDSDALRTLSKAVGEDEGTVRSGLTSLIPTIIAGIASKAGSNASSLDAVVNIGKQLINLPGASDILKNPASMLNAGGATALVTRILETLFGSKVSTILSSLSAATGMRESSMKSLATAAVGMAFGKLNALASASGGQFNATSLTSVLSKIGPEMSGALPATISGLLGSSLGKPLMSAAAAATAEYGVPNTLRTPPTQSGSRPTLWGLAFLALVGGVWYLMSRTNNAAQQMASDVRTSTKGIISDVEKRARSAMEMGQQQANAAVESARNAIETGVNAIPSDESNGVRARLGDALDQIQESVNVAALPAGLAVEPSTNSTEGKLLGFIRDTGKAIDKTTWFDFDAIGFQTGSSMLSTESSGQLDRVASILMAYPAVEIKVGGYTDATGNPDSNVMLSSQRAEAVVRALATRGVAADRMEFEGYGAAHPVASNDTAEGRAMNRRIALRVMAK